jgi:aspartyl/glutamyl-tRNA(Asn/Gln) amidotransferase C subunit
MSINKETLEKLSLLAKIEIKEEEIPNYLESFNKLLTSLTALQQVDLAAVPADILLNADRTQYLREDIITEHPTPGFFQKIAHKTLQNFYLVPKVIEGDQK